MVKKGSGSGYVCLADGHLALLHGLQQRGLGLGRRTVDFVGQQDVGEDRALDKTKIAPAVLVLFQDIGAGDVRRHQVGSELDSFKLDVEDAGQGADHQGLGQARHAHQQAVAAGEDGGEHLLDHIRLTDDHFLQFFLHQPSVLTEFLQDVAQVSRFHDGHEE